VQLIDGVSAGMFQALNPLFIVLFAPVFAYLWVYLNKKNIEPNATVKFAMAILFISIGFFSLVVGSGFAGDDFKVSLIFLVVMYLFHTFGELCLSPVGLSMVTRLSIVRIAGLMMGIWFLSSSLAGYVSGLIAGLMSIPTDIVDIQNKRAVSLEIYSSNFETLGMLALVVSLFLFLISPIVSKYMKD
jgi:POT family proton-dependent oligopeptide transporter